MFAMRIVLRKVDSSVATPRQMVHVFIVGQRFNGYQKSSCSCTQPLDVSPAFSSHLASSDLKSFKLFTHLDAVEVDKWTLDYALTNLSYLTTILYTSTQSPTFSFEFVPRP